MIQPYIKPAEMTNQGMPIHDKVMPKGNQITPHTMDGIRGKAQRRAFSARLTAKKNQNELDISRYSRSRFARAANHVAKLNSSVIETFHFSQRYVWHSDALCQLRCVYFRACDARQDMHLICALCLS